MGMISDDIVPEMKIEMIPVVETSIEVVTEITPVVIVDEQSQCEIIE